MKLSQSDVGDHLAKIGGADMGALTWASTCRSAFQQMGAALLVTAFMAFISMWFAMHDAVGVNGFAAVPLALGWAVAIFTLDRLLITVGMGSGIASTITMTVVRLAVASLIGIIVSTPLTMRVFHDDIQYQLGQMAVDNGAVNKEKIARSQEKAAVNSLKASIVEQENIQQGVLPKTLDSSEGAATSAAISRLDSLGDELKTAQHAADQAAILYNCERYGGGRQKLDDPSKCAVKPGPNGNATLYQRQAQARAADLAAVQDKIAAQRKDVDSANASQLDDQKDLLNELAAAAPRKLADLRKGLPAAQAALSALEERLGGENTGNTGLLASLEALHHASEENSTLAWAHWLLVALFALIELMPVLAKLMWSFGPRAATYSQVLAMKDGSGLGLAHVEINAADDVEKKRIEDERDRDITLNRDANTEIAKVLREEMMREVAEWSKGVRGTGQVRFTPPSALPPPLPAPPSARPQQPGDGTVAP